MELSDYTPMLINEYVKQPFGHWDGQTRVSDNHSWSCVTLADGRKVRTQGQLVPDSLLSAEDLVASNAAKHQFDVVYNGTTYQMTEFQAAVVEHLFQAHMNRFGFSLDQLQMQQMHEDLAREELALPPYVFTEQGERVLPDQQDMDKAQAWMDANPEADAGSHAEMFQGLTQQYYRERLATSNRVLGQDMMFDFKQDGKLVLVVRFDTYVNDRGDYHGYHLVVDGKEVDSTDQTWRNMCTGLLNHFGYRIQDFLTDLPQEMVEILTVLIGVPAEAGGYELMDRAYTKRIRYTNPGSDMNTAMTHQFGYKTWQQMRAAGFDSDTSLIASQFKGKLQSMFTRTEERDEILTILDLQLISKSE